MTNIKIKRVDASNKEDILAVNMDAFENYGADEIKVLVSDLMEDESAEPIVSLLAYDGDRAVGHIFFTKATIENKENSLTAYILAPLSVIKKYQNQGIGGMLINEGRKILENMGVDIIFVLGHVTYYPKYGFINNATMVPRRWLYHK